MTEHALFVLLKPLPPVTWYEIYSSEIVMRLSLRAVYFHTNDVAVF